MTVWRGHAQKATKSKQTNSVFQRPRRRKDIKRNRDTADFIAKNGKHLQRANAVEGSITGAEKYNQKSIQKQFRTQKKINQNNQSK